jgi:TAT-translocated FGD2 family F420-dependent dehydrogenase
VTPFLGYHCAAEQFAPSELVDLAVAAEEAGFQGVTVSDHLHPWQDNQGHAGHAWMMLAAIAARTQRLVLGTGITCPIYRYHPLEVAHAFATLGVLFPGRVFIGVGTGEAVNEAPSGGWGPYRERSARLVEAIHLIRALWTGEVVDFDGRYFPVRGARLYDVPNSPVPIYVAASGVKSVRIAAREGDGWITDHGTLRRAVAQKDGFEQEARAAGKDPRALPRITELWAVAGEREEALAAARRWLFLPVFPDVVDLPNPIAVQEHAEALSSPERVIADWTVSPDPGAHIAAVRELATAGATHIFLHSPQEDQRAVIDFYRRDVLPALR